MFHNKTKYESKQLWNSIDVLVQRPSFYSVIVLQIAYSSRELSQWWTLRKWSHICNAASANTVLFRTFNENYYYIKELEELRLKDSLVFCDRQKNLNLNIHTLKLLIEFDILKFTNVVIRFSDVTLHGLFVNWK